ncbi:antitoxin [Novosphingobium sp. RD2P27]|uniref:Antitoxin n=1 Tax=Novosphingobium kalidii TaxID=3230299 RepID=A0ABV2D3N2_9SPHN
MNAERALYEDPDALDLSRKRALADIKAGRVVPHEAVRDWLKTWGTADEKPMPAEWLK